MITEREVIENCACQKVRTAARAVTRAYDEALRPVGLRATQLAVLEIDVGGVTEHVESSAGLLQRVELVEELLFGQFFLGEAALGLVMGVNEVLHVVLLDTLGSGAYTRHSRTLLIGFL